VRDACGRRKKAIDRLNQAVGRLGSAVGRDDIQAARKSARQTAADCQKRVLGSNYSSLKLRMLTKSNRVSESRLDRRESRAEPLLLGVKRPGMKVEGIDRAIPRPDYRGY